MGCSTSKTAVLPAEGEGGLPTSKPAVHTGIPSGVSNSSATSASGGRGTPTVFDDSGSEAVAATGSPGSVPRHPVPGEPAGAHPEGKRVSNGDTRRASAGEVSTATTRDGVSITSTAFGRGGSEAEMRPTSDGSGGATPPATITAPDVAEQYGARSGSAEGYTGTQGMGSGSLAAERSDVDAGDSDAESVHAFEEGEDVDALGKVIRHAPSVKVRSPDGKEELVVGGAAASSVEFGSALLSTPGGDGGDKPRHGSDGRDSFAGSVTATSSGGTIVRPGDAVYGDVPGGAPQRSPFKRPKPGHAGPIDGFALDGEGSPSGGDGKPPTSPSLPGVQVTGMVDTSTTLAERHSAAAETRLLKGVESFRIMRGAGPRERRDNVLPVDSFELHAFHAAKEGAGGPMSPAKFRPAGGVMKSEDEAVLIQGSMDRTALFGHLSGSDRDRVVSAFSQATHKPGEAIMKEGDLGDTFYVLGSGQAMVKQAGKRSGMLHPGAGFGELAMLYQEPRAATVTAMVPCMTWQLTRSDFRAIVVTSAARAHQQHIRFLRGVSLFKTLTERQLSSLADALTPAHFRDKECVVRQGTQGNVFFMILSGTVRVVKRMRVTTGGDTDSDGSSTARSVQHSGDLGLKDGAPADAVGLEEVPAASAEDEGEDMEDVELMRLGAGSHFGEQSLIHGVQRQASVYAVGPVQCLALMRSDFISLLGSLKDAMNAAHTKRQAAERVATLRATRSFIGMLALTKQKATPTAKPSRRYSGGKGLSELGAVKVADRRSLLDDDLPKSRPSVSKTSSLPGTTAPSRLTPTTVKAAPLGGGLSASATSKATSVDAARVAGHRPKRASMDSIVGFRGGIGAGPGHRRKGPGGLSLDLTASNHTIAEGAVLTDSAVGAGGKTRAIIPGAAFPRGGAATAPHSSEAGPGGFSTPPGGAATGAGGATAAQHGHSALGAVAPSLAGARDAAAGRAAPGFRAAVHSFRRVATDVTKESLVFMAVLGEGAFGQVTLVKHVTTGKLYAMKQMQKARIVKMKQQRNVLNEKSILMRVREHPYILNLVKTFNTPNSLYLVLEFLQGGDLFGLMSRLGGRLEPYVAKYYAAVVTSVLGFLHRRNIIYRDLKPENLVLDGEGYLRVVDFGFAKVVPDKTYTLCGTPEYIAPEMVTSKGHGKGVDYWALGVLIYEMFAGYSPFADHEGRDHRKIYKKILKGTYRWSSKIKDDLARDLISRLLESNPAKRLGCLARGEDDIRRHWWFASFDWAALDAKTLAPPVVPDLKGKADVSQFEDFKSTPQAKIVPYKDDGTGWDKEF